MQVFTGDGVYRFKSMDERNEWLDYYFPRRYPADQEGHPGRFLWQDWLIKIFGDGISVKIMGLRGH